MPRYTWSTNYLITMPSTAQGSKSERAVLAVETIGPAVLNGGATTFQTISHQDHQEQHHPHLQENYISSSYIPLKIILHRSDDLPGPGSSGWLNLSHFPH